MTNTGSSSNFVKRIYFLKIVVPNTNMHLCFIGAYVSVAQLNMMLVEINNILVVISFFVLSQTPSDSSALPLPELHSSH